MPRDLFTFQDLVLLNLRAFTEGKRKEKRKVTNFPSLLLSSCFIPLARFPSLIFFSLILHDRDLASQGASVFYVYFRKCLLYVEVSPQSMLGTQLDF